MTLFAWIVYLLCFIKSFYSSISNIRGEGKGPETNLERLGRIMHFLTKWVFLFLHFCLIFSNQRSFELVKTTTSITAGYQNLPNVAFF